MHPVDALLHDARQLLGDHTPTALPTLAIPQPPTPPAGWTSEAADNAQAAGDTLHRNLTRIADLHATARALIDEASDTVLSARTQLQGIEHQWAADQASATADATNPDGASALLSAARDHTTTITELVRATAEHFHASAQKLAAITKHLA